VHGDCYAWMVHCLHVGGYYSGDDLPFLGHLVGYGRTFVVMMLHSLQIGRRLFSMSYSTIPVFLLLHCSTLEITFSLEVHLLLHSLEAGGTTPFDGLCLEVVADTWEPRYGFDAGLNNNILRTCFYTMCIHR
jgi:hypothetical protein